MASRSEPLSEEQVQCSICLEVFASPVSTPCGHTFCRACIYGYWPSSGVCQCPLCKESFLSRPELRINRSLAEIAEHFQRTRTNGEQRPSERDEQPSDTPRGVACSGSQPHLEPHLRVEGLEGHKLVPPVRDLGDRMCRKHGRPLELFCRSDRTCVCVLCTDADHRSHDTVPAERAWTENKAHLKKTGSEVQQMMQDRQRKVQEIRECVELSRSSTQREIEDSVEVFSALMRSIEVGQAVLTDVMGEKQRALEQRAEGLIKDLEQELTELQKRNTELEKLSNTEDHLHFLQSFPALCTPPPTKDWSDASVHTDVCAESVRSVMSHLEDSLTEQMGKLRDKVGAAEPEKMRDRRVNQPDTMVPKEPPREMQGRQKHRKGQKAETKALYWQVRGIVETVSQQTFRQAMKRMSDLTINTEHKLRIVVEHIYEKAVSNPATAVVCANMARCLMGMKVPLADNPGRTLNLRKLLLNRCQKEFQRGLDKDEDVDDDETASRVWEEAEAHQRWLRNIAFTCELFKQKMLTEAIMHDCIVHMLKRHREHLLEGLCCLLSTIGKDFDSQKAKPRMDQYYNQLENIVKTGTVSPRIRSMVQDVLNLRRSGFHT